MLDAKEWTTYVNHGNLPLWEQLTKMYPWLTEENAKRIAVEALSCDKAKHCDSMFERAYQTIKYARAAAMRYKPNK